MSEYQFYEFAAVDRPLTSAQQEQLRRISSRANITAFSFTNVYHFGGLKADPLSPLRDFFDVLVYSTDANHCWLALRLLAHVCDRSLLPAYTGDLPPAGFPYAIPSFSFHFEAEYWLVNWEFSKPSVENRSFHRSKRWSGLARSIAAAA